MHNLDYLDSLGLSSEAVAYAKTLTTPDGFRFCNYLGSLGIEAIDGSCSFRLTDRTFGLDEMSDILAASRGAISQGIEKAILRADSPITVLDLACGSRSKAAAMLARHYGPQKVNVVGVDFCESPVRERADNLRFLRADARELPLEDDSVNFAYSVQFITHLPYDQREAVVDELVRVLAPGATAIIDCLDYHPQADEWARGYAAFNFSSSKKAMLLPMSSADTMVAGRFMMAQRNPFARLLKNSF